MKIAFNNEIFINQAYGGISRYICELAENLNATEDTTARIFAPLHRNAYLEKLPEAVRGRTYRLPFVRRTTKVIRALSTMLSAPQIRSFRPDILHQTYYTLDFKPPRGANRVLTVYDMIHERFPQLFPNETRLSAIKRKAVQSCDHVICISRHTQLDLIEMYEVKHEKTSVVHLGFEINIGGCAPYDQQANKLARPYVLYVGSRGAYKNFYRFVRAYASSTMLKRNYAIVCFGGGAFHRDEELLIEHAGLDAEDIIHIGGGDRVLAGLYARAALFVYPSLYEGFGIPPLEAMSFGCPVVCAEAGSIPEVVGDAALYFDGLDQEALRDAMEKVLSSSEIAAQLRARGRARCTEFSWAKCAAESRAVYAKLLL